jgi:hypothetical protein
MTGTKLPNEKIETMSPWTIKAISSTAKDAIIEASRRDRMNIGEWVALAAREKIEGRPEQETVPVKNGVDRPSAPTFASSAEAVALAVQLAGVPAKRDSPMLQAARESVRIFLLSQSGSSVE